MKVLHPIAGRSMIGHVLAAVRGLEPTPGRRGRRPPARAGRARTSSALMPDGGPRRPGRPARHRPRRPDRLGGARAGTSAPAPSSWRTATRRSSRARACAASPRTTRPPRRAVSMLSGVVADPFGYGRVVRDDERRGRPASSRRRTRRPSSATVHEINIAASSPSTRSSSTSALPRLRQRQRQGRVLPHRHGRRWRATTGCTVGAFPHRRRAADRGRQRPRPAGRARPRAQPPHPRAAGCARA